MFIDGVLIVHYKVSGYLTTGMICCINNTFAFMINTWSYKIDLCKILTLTHCGSEMPYGIRDYGNY